MRVFLCDVEEDLLEDGLADEAGHPVEVAGGVVVLLDVGQELAHREGLLGEVGVQLV